MGRARVSPDCAPSALLSQVSPWPEMLAFLSVCQAGASVPGAGVGRWPAAGDFVASGSPELGSLPTRAKGSVVWQVGLWPPCADLPCSVFRMCFSSASR